MLRFTEMKRRGRGVQPGIDTHNFLRRLGFRRLGLLTEAYTLRRYSEELDRRRRGTSGEL